MKLAVIGTRSVSVSDIGSYIPKEADEIVSGGATCKIIIVKNDGEV